MSRREREIENLVIPRFGVRTGIAIPDQKGDCRESDEGGSAGDTSWCESA